MTAPLTPAEAAAAALREWIAGAVEPPSTDLDVDATEAHDWAIPCGYSLHPLGARDDPATLAVWMQPYPKCGHHPKPFLYFCDECWARRGSAPGVHCTVCHAPSGTFDAVIRVERI